MLSYGLPSSDYGLSMRRSQAVSESLVGLPAQYYAAPAFPEPAGRPMSAGQPTVIRFAPSAPPTRRDGGGSTSSLGPLERSVLNLSRNDSMNSTMPAGILRRIWEAIFGSRQSNRLADPSLEALRTFAVQARFSNPMRFRQATEDALRAGYSEYQLREVKEVLNRL